MGSASPAPKARAAGHSGNGLHSAAIETVLLVKPALVAQCSAARIEIALLGIETALVAPIGSLALLVAPIIRVARRRCRFPGHGSSDALQNIACILGVRRQRSQQERQRTDHQRQPHHYTLPCACDAKTGLVPALLCKTPRRGLLFLLLFYYRSIAPDDFDGRGV
jgi:hypothetical protein